MLSTKSIFASFFFSIAKKFENKKKGFKCALPKKWKFFNLRTYGDFQKKNSCRQGLRSHFSNNFVMIVYWSSTTITWYVNCPSSEKLSNSPLCDAVNVEQNPKNIVVGDPPQGGHPSMWCSQCWADSKKLNRARPPSGGSACACHLTDLESDKGMSQLSLDIFTATNSKFCHKLR